MATWMKSMKHGNQSKLVIKSFIPLAEYYNTDD